MAPHKQATWASALGSADLFEAVSALRKQILNVHPADWTAAYVLLCLNHVFPQGFIGGRLAIPCPDREPKAFPSTQVDTSAKPGASGLHAESVDVDSGTIPASQLLVRDVAGLHLVQRDIDRISRIGGLDCPVVRVFDKFELKQVPGYVNHCLSRWSMGLRPLILMLRVATPSELLTMQAKGRRCITCFCGQEELGQEWADSYPPYAIKDTLRFVFHDMQHAERFTQAEYYCEQVGFLHRMRRVHARLQRGDSSVVDRQLRLDVAHVVSDMNSCCVHLLEFLVRRLACAAKRTSQEAKLSGEIAEVLGLLLDTQQHGDCQLDLAWARAIFHEEGVRQLAAQIPDHGQSMAALWPLQPSGKESLAAISV